MREQGDEEWEGGIRDKRQELKAEGAKHIHLMKEKEGKSEDGNQATKLVYRNGCAAGARMKSQAAGVLQLSVLLTGKKSDLDLT